MQETSVLRKTKISLADYDYKKDIENRNLLSSFSEIELNILEELLFSPIKTSVSKLAKDLDIQEKKVLFVLKTLQNTHLLKIDGPIINIEKKIRKYFEFEYLRFEETFKPDLTFINNLLSKIPIHILPVWYSLPKTSNNIFQSIIDKYFLTPQIFKRHIEDLENENFVFSGIIKDLYNSENFEISSKEVKKKYKLDQEKYLEMLLLLEFNFICFQAYKKTTNGYEEILIPFYEYKEYLDYFNKTKTPSITESQKIIKKRNSDFGFVEDLTSILQMAKKGIFIPIIEENLKKEINIKDPNIIISNAFFSSLINKLLQIKFLTKNQNLLELTISANKWLELTIDHKALHLYYHPLNVLNDPNISNELLNEKNIREAEKSIIRIIKKDWVFFDDFVKGILSPITDEHHVKIKPIGKVYRYSIPSYTKEEIIFIKKVIFERLFEAGIVNVGCFNGKDCFCVTQLGETLFDVN
jgi:hypothetical protein